MIEEDGDVKVKALGDKAALIRHACFLGSALVLTGIVWNNLSRDVAQADQKGKDNAAQIEAVKDKIGKIEVQQQVIITNQNNDQRNQSEFRARTESALESILNKLERAERRDTDRESR